MNTLRLYITLVLVSLFTAAFAVILPSHSFYGANELYAENQDVVETDAGTKFGKINIRLATDNSSWGNDCWSQSYEDKYKCQDCCGEKLDAAEEAEGPSEATDVLYDSCMKTCDATSLPLGSALWLLPFALAYGIVKRYRKQQE